MKIAQNSPTYFAWHNVGSAIIGSRACRAIRGHLETANDTQPYHNAVHCMQVALIADKMMLAEYGDPSREERAILFLAASLHDYGHSAGVDTDDINVKRSADFVLANGEALLAEASIKHTAYITRKAYTAIRCTEYSKHPYQHGMHFPYGPTNKMERCLRDADLLMCTTEQWPEFFAGLKAEMKSEMTEEQNIAWLSQQVMFTDEGQDMLDRVVKSFHGRAKLKKVMGTYESPKEGGNE